jgi:hypothetical protein
VSKTYRFHASKTKLAKRGGTTRSKVAQDAHFQTGAGPHGKSKKAQRRAERVALKKGNFDA